MNVSQKPTNQLLRAEQRWCRGRA